MNFPEHCINCHWILHKFGSCPYPDVSLLYSVISVIPYTLIIVLAILTIIKRKVTYIGASIIIVSCYIFADKILKNFVQGNYNVNLRS
jgi:hypothetical protein